LRDYHIVEKERERGRRKSGKVNRGARGPNYLGRSESVDFYKKVIGNKSLSRRSVGTILSHAVRKREITVDEDKAGKVTYSRVDVRKIASRNK